MHYTSFPLATTHEEAWEVSRESVTNLECPGMWRRVEDVGVLSWKESLDWSFEQEPTHTCQAVSRETKPLLWDPLSPLPLPHSVTLTPLSPSSGTPHCFSLHSRSQIISGFLWIVLREIMGKEKITGEAGFKNHVLGGSTYKIIRPSRGHGRLRLN